MFITADSDVKTLRSIASISSNSNSESSEPTTHAPGPALQFQFVDEQERKRNPKSHLRTIVRANAKRHALSARRALNVRSVRPKKLEKAKGPRSILNSAAGGLDEPSSTDPGIIKNKENEKLWFDVLVDIGVRDGASFSSDPGSSVGGLEVKRSLSILTKQKGTREISKLSVRKSVVKSHGHRPSKRAPESSGQVADWQLTSPQTILGAGRIDPFDSFPIRMKHHMHYLVHYCESFLFTRISSICH
jgi:hypothetical protein